MSIRFQFDLSKAIAAMAYVVDRLGAVDKIKLVKLMYLADRRHLIRHGYPITGDRQVAMRLGPVPSGCLDALNGQLPHPSRVFDHLHVSDAKVMLLSRPKPDPLEASERETLDRVITEHGGKDTWDLVRETHGYPEYEETYVEDASTTIPYELILRHHGGEDRFRHNRPVISEAMAAHMVSPFRGPENDL